MIIFDLDGTLADCEHRQHFVDPYKNKYIYAQNCNCRPSDCHCGQRFGKGKWVGEDRLPWQSDWQLFYEACSDDKPIEPVVEIYNNCKHKFGEKTNIHIWSGRSESVRDKTLQWLGENFIYCQSENLRMRPIGDNTPDDQLKERWLDEYCDVLYDNNRSKYREMIEHDIQFVFDSDPESIAMWRRRGIFVFNCCQHYGEF